jgi:8-oxo-dGTP pyrophosphatase MutT (NUDIX family)
VLTPFHVIEQPDWVTAIAITTDGRVVLVEEYRHGARQAVIELPSGIHEGPGEPVDQMKRELLEETGFASEDWHPLGAFFANAPRLSNRVHCFLALDVRKVTEPAPDDGEIIVTHEVPLPRFLEELRDGRRTFHGFQGGALWLLDAYARKTRDKRLAALLD